MPPPAGTGTAAAISESPAQAQAQAPPITAKQTPEAGEEPKYAPRRHEMTDAQYQILLSLRERVDDLIEPVMSNNPILRRFLVARDYNLAASEALLRKAMTWRKKFGVSSLNLTGEVNTALKLGIIDVWKHLDRYKRPVLILHPSRINPKFKGFDVMDVVKVVVMKLEAAIKEMTDGVETVVVVIDFNDFGMRNVTFDPLRELIQVLQDYYPERMGALFLVDSPFIFNAVWTIMSPWVDEKTREKIHFVPSMTDLGSIFAAGTMPPAAADSSGADKPKIDAWAKWTDSDTVRERREVEAIRYAHEDSERRRLEAEEEEEERLRIEAEDLEAKLNWRRSQAVGLDALPQLPPMQPRDKDSRGRAGSGTGAGTDDAQAGSGDRKRRGSGGWRRSLRLVRGSLQRGSLTTEGAGADAGSSVNVSGGPPILDASVTAAAAGGESGGPGHSRKHSRRQSIIFRWRKAAVDAAAEQGTDLEDQLRAELGFGPDGDAAEKDKEKEKDKDKDGGEEGRADKPKGILRRRTFSGSEEDSIGGGAGGRKGILRRSGTFDAPKIEDDDVHPDALLRINTERNRASGMFDKTAATVPPDEQDKDTDKDKDKDKDKDAFRPKDRPRSILRRSGTFDVPKLDEGGVHPDALLRINTERNRASGMFDAVASEVPPEPEPEPKAKPKGILRRSGTFDSIDTSKGLQAQAQAQADSQRKGPAEAEDVVGGSRGPRSILRRSGTFDPPKIDDGGVHPDALLRINTERNRASGMFDATAIPKDNEKPADVPAEQPKPRKSSLRRTASTSSIDVKQMLRDDEMAEKEKEKEKEKEREKEDRRGPRSILRRSGTFEPPKIDGDGVHPDALLRINTERNKASGVFEPVTVPPPEPEPKAKPKGILRRSGTFDSIDVVKPAVGVEASGDAGAGAMAETAHDSLQIGSESEGEGGGVRRSRRMSLRFSAAVASAVDQEAIDKEMKEKEEKAKQKEEEDRKAKAKRMSSTTLKAADLDRRVIAPVITTEETEFRAPPKLPGKGGSGTAVAGTAGGPGASGPLTPADIVAKAASSTEKLEDLLSSEWVDKEADREEREEREAMDEKRRMVSERKRQSINILMAAVSTEPDARRKAQELASELHGGGDGDKGGSRGVDRERGDSVSSIDAIAAAATPLKPRNKFLDIDTSSLGEGSTADPRIQSVEPPLVPRPSVADSISTDDSGSNAAAAAAAAVADADADEWERGRGRARRAQRFGGVGDSDGDSLDDGSGVAGAGVGSSTEPEKPKHESYQDATSLTVASAPEQEEEFRAPPRRSSRSGSLRGSLSMPKLARPSMAFLKGFAADTSLEDEIRREAADAAREAAAAAPTTAVVGEGGAKVHDRRASLHGAMPSEDKRRSGYNLQVAMAQVASEEGVGLSDLERDIKSGQGDTDESGNKRRMSRRFSLMFKGAAKRAVQQARDEAAEKAEQEKEKEEKDKGKSKSKDKDDDEDPLTSEKTSKKKRRGSVFDAFRKKRISELVAEAADGARAEEETARAAAHAAKVNQDNYDAVQMVVEDAGAIPWIPEGYAVADYDRSWAALPPEVPLEDALDSEPDVDVGDEDVPVDGTNLFAGMLAGKLGSMAASTGAGAGAGDGTGGGIFRKRADTRTPGRAEAFERRDARLREAAVRDIERTLKEKEQRVRLLMRQRVRRRRKQSERMAAQKQAEDSILGSVVSSLASLVEWSMNADDDTESISESGGDGDAEAGPGTGAHVPAHSRAHARGDADIDIETDSDALSEASLDDYDLDVQAERRRARRERQQQQIQAQASQSKRGYSHGGTGGATGKGLGVPVPLDPSNDVEVAAASVVPTYYDLTVRGFMQGADFFYTPKELKEREAARQAEEERIERERREAEERAEEERLRREALARRERLKAEVEKKLMEQHDLVLKRERVAAEEAEAEREAAAELKRAEELAEARRARQVALAKQKAAERKEEEETDAGAGASDHPILRRRSSSLTFNDDVDADGTGDDDEDETESQAGSHTSSLLGGLGPTRSPSPPPKLGLGVGQVDWGDDEDDDESDEEVEETPLQRRLREAAEKRGGSPPPALKHSGSHSSHESDAGGDAKPKPKLSDSDSDSDDDDMYTSLGFNPSQRHVD